MFGGELAFKARENAETKHVYLYNRYVVAKLHVHCSYDLSSLMGHGVPLSRIPPVRPQPELSTPPRIVLFPGILHHSQPRPHPPIPSFSIVGFVFQGGLLKSKKPHRGEGAYRHRYPTKDDETMYDKSADGLAI